MEKLTTSPTNSSSQNIRENLRDNEERKEEVNTYMNHLPAFSSQSRAGVQHSRSSEGSEYDARSENTLSKLVDIYFIHSYSI